MSRIVLRVRGQGHVPSFKNSKMLCRGRLITDPKKREWMDAATASLVFQLYSASVTHAPETGTERCLRSLIASATQFDDSIQWIPEIHVRAVRCAKGDEGAEIAITLL